MTQIPTIFRISDDEPEIYQNFYHKLVVWLSLKSLTCYWEAYPSIIENLPAIRIAAREALYEYHEHSRDQQVEDIFKTALKDTLKEGSLKQVTEFLSGAVCVTASMKGTGNLTDWYRWISPNQHRPDVPGMNPATAAQLMNHYKSDVVQKSRKHDDYVRKTVKEEVLDDWDLFIQQAYEACYEETDRWPESIILIEVAQLLNAMLFNHFMRTRVLALSENDQQLLLTEIRRERKQDIEEMKADEQMDELTQIMHNLPDDPEDEARNILPAKEVVIW